MEQEKKPDSGGVQITIDNRTRTPITVTGSVVSYAAPAETRRELCEREAREWDETAIAIVAAGPRVSWTPEGHHIDPEDLQRWARHANRAETVCRATAEEWRARARRCAR
jgi:hypothetical protein